MTTQERVVAPSEISSPKHTPEKIRREPRWRPAIRFVLAVVGAALITRLLWTLVPDKLSVRTNIIGYPTFYNYDSPRLTYGYYFVALLFPILCLAIYTAVARFGPLRKLGTPSERMFPIVTDLAADRMPDDTAADEDHVGPMDACWIVARVALVAIAIALEVSIANVGTTQLGSSGAYAAGGIVFVAVFSIGTLLWRLGRSGQHASSGTSWRGSVALVNSVTALAIIPLLYLTSEGTAVVLGSHSETVTHSWLPLWTMIMIFVFAVALWVRGFVNARKARAFGELEAKTLVWLVGPVLFFLLVAQLPGAFGPFQAFDDAQFLAGPQLIFHHGLFPWSEIYALHGLLNDVFEGAIGMVVFGNTRWGANAGFGILVLPLTLVGIYAFAAYFCRRNRLVLVAVTIAFATQLLVGASVRFVLFPVGLILLDQVLKRPGWFRCSLFMITLFVGAVLSPELVLFVPVLVGTVVLFDLTGRQKGTPLTEAFRRTWQCVAAGLALTALWVVFLAGTGALAGFVDYFLEFAQGHALEGSYPPQWNLTQDLTVTFYWAIPTLLLLATFWRIVAKLRIRGTWSTRDWVMVAAAACSAFYFLQALDRADFGHVIASFSIALFLFILWILEILESGDRLVRNGLERLPRFRAVFGFRHVVTGLAVIGVIVGASVYPEAQTLSSAVSNAPGRFHTAVSAASAPAMKMLGYTAPNTVDVGQIRALGSVLDRYAGSTAPVFDYSNEPGIVYYLLNRVPGTRFYHSDVIQTPQAQHQVISDLSASRPPIVVFSNTTFGLLTYDGIAQTIRSYDVSEYLFAHYRPLLDVQGQLLLLRDDLFATAPPPPPGTTTANLYFDTPSCNFGYIPNFFSVPTHVEQQKGIPVSKRDILRVSAIVHGWALDATSGAAASEVLAASDGRVVASSPTGMTRPDVAQVMRDPAATNSGFELALPTGSGPVELYSLNADGSVSPLATSKAFQSGHFAGTVITTPDGVSHPIVPSGRSGFVDYSTPTASTVYKLTPPTGVSWASNSWVRILEPGGLKNNAFVIADQPSAPASHQVDFNTLQKAQSAVDVEVGSCLQWHGYSPGQPLYLFVNGPPGNLEVSLIH